MIDVKRILEEANLHSAGEYHITAMEEMGDNIVINCPYHKGGTERTASFSILTKDKMSRNGTIDAGVGHCFACGASRTLPQLISHIMGQESIEQSTEWLKKNYGVNISTAPQVRLLVPPTEEDGETLEYKHYRVEYHEFFQRRGITPQSVQLFELGIDNQFGYAVFPIKNKHGECKMLFKRSLEGKRFYNTAGAKKENLLFGLNTLYENLTHYANAQQVWIVESVIDAILLWQQGYLALAMLQAIPTEAQLELIGALPFNELIIATDNDDAGHKGYKEFEDKLKGKTLYRLQYQQHQKDIGDFTEKEMREAQIVKSTRQNIRRGLSLG